MQDAGNNPVMNVDPSGLLFELSDITRLLPSIPQPVYDFSMGLSNGVSFGLAQPISNWANGYSTANVDSQIYKVGEYSSLFASAGGAAVKATITGMREAAVSANVIANSTKSSFSFTAEIVADAALAAGKRTGAAAELRVGNKTITGVSGQVVPHNSNVTGVLMGTPQAQRAGWHGACAEIVCLDKALNAGINPAGGTMRAINIGVSGAGHNTPKVICSSCKDVLRYFGVKY